MLARPTTWIVVAGLLGLLAVALGAFGAHALADRFAARPAAAQWWQTAVQYHALHALALLGLAAAWTRLAPGWAIGSALAWTLGVLVFAGTLYAMALGAPRGLGAMTPLGGLALIAGWAMLVAAAWRAP